MSLKSRVKSWKKGRFWAVVLALVTLEELVWVWNRETHQQNAHALYGLLLIVIPLYFLALAWLRFSREPDQAG